MEYKILSNLAKVSDLLENQKLTNNTKIYLNFEPNDFQNLLLEVKNHYNFNDFFNKKEINLKIGLVEFIISKNNV